MNVLNPHSAYSRAPKILDLQWGQYGFNSHFLWGNFLTREQALVRESCKDPISIFGTNVQGSIYVLKASQSITKLQAQLVVAINKVYRKVLKLSG